MKKKLLFRRIAATLIFTLFMTQISFSNEFVNVAGAIKYKLDDGSYVTGTWRWIDTNDDGIAECYRFDDDGRMLMNTTYNGKRLNENGMWIEDGVIKQLMLATGRPYGDHSKDKDVAPIFKGQNGGVINASGKTDDKIQNVEKTHNIVRGELVISNAKNATDSQGRIISRGANPRYDAPVAVASSGQTIVSFTQQDDYKVLASGSRIIGGRDMAKYVTSSTNFEKNISKVTVYGGDVWTDCMCLKGNGAKVKFNSAKSNYFRIEVAHQTHTAATSDTFCYIELYEDGVQTLTFDNFNDDKPELIEEFIDEDTKTIELRLVVTGDAPGRKVYLREGRFRTYTEKQMENMQSN